MDNKEPCYLNKPCEDKNKACDLSNNKCESIPESRHEIIWNIHGKKYKGNIGTVFRLVSEYFSYLYDRKCTQGFDVFLALDEDNAKDIPEKWKKELDDPGFFEFRDKDFSQLREVFVKNRIIGFADIREEKTKIFCETTDELFQYWTKNLRSTGISQGVTGSQRGVLITPALLKKINNEYKKSIDKGHDEEESIVLARRVMRKNTKNQDVKYMIRLFSSGHSSYYLERSDIKNIIKGKYVMYVLLPTDIVWIDVNPAVMSTYHNYDPVRKRYGDIVYKVVGIGPKNRKSILPTDSKEVENLYFPKGKKIPFKDTDRKALTGWLREIIDNYTFIKDPDFIYEKAVELLDNRIASLDNMVSYGTLQCLGGAVVIVAINLFEKSDIPGYIDFIDDINYYSDNICGKDKIVAMYNDLLKFSSY